MAHSTILMHRYSIVGSDWISRIVSAATLYRDRYHLVPNICHIPDGAKDAPPNVGVIKVERAWGLQRNEIDLGVAPVLVQDD